MTHHLQMEPNVGMPPPPDTTTHAEKLRLCIEEVTQLMDMMPGKEDLGPLDLMIVKGRMVDEKLERMVERERKMALERAVQAQQQWPTTPSTQANNLGGFVPPT